MSSPKSKRIDKAVGAKIREKRIAAAMTQLGVADALVTSVSAVSNLEAGVSSAKPATLKKLAELFKCEPGDFLG